MTVSGRELDGEEGWWLSGFFSRQVAVQIRDNPMSIIVYFILFFNFFIIRLIVANLYDK